jgi:ubiquinone/menaquinone biosynthesis C-methylase UbiE
MIDRVKRYVQGRLKLPCPPYQDPMYWEGAYRKLGPHDVFEWGGHCYADLAEYKYKLVKFELGQTSTINQYVNGNATVHETTWGETIGVQPKTTNNKERSPTDNINNASEKLEHILMLGCGNSELGEHMIQSGWAGPIVMVDVASRVVESMSQRCAAYLAKGEMNFITDDASQLSAFNDGAVDAAIDKGMMDAIFCSEDYTVCYDILQAAHRVLKPGGIFTVCSFSRPEFFLNFSVIPLRDKYATSAQVDKYRKMWSDVQIRQLESIFIYRFVKDGIRPGYSRGQDVSPPKKSKRR